MIQACEWEMIKIHEQLPTPKISPFLFKKSITESDILEKIETHQITGFILCNITPTEGARKYERMNWPPIFTRDDVDHDMLPTWMKDMTNKSTFPRATLLQSMRAEQILLHTKLVDFYLRNGFKITCITKFIEYEPSPCFQTFYDTLYRLRVDATIENNSAQATAIKLTGNSPYGKVMNFNFKVYDFFIIILDHPEPSQILQTRNLRKKNSRSKTTKANLPRSQQVDGHNVRDQGENYKNK